MQRSETIGKLFGALAKAQLAMDDASKDSSNPHFRSKYADLSSVRDAIRRPFAENGLAYTQFARFNAEARTVEVETMLVHGESGEFVSDTLAIPCPQATAHAIGSAITYGRRFSLMAVSGVAPAEDDDGNAAVATLPPARDRKAAAAPAEPKQPPQEPKPAPAAPSAPSAQPNVPAAGEPTAEQLFAGIPDLHGYEGLRAIVSRINQATAQAAKGMNPATFPPEYKRAALDAAYNEWDAWRRSMWSKLAETDQDAVSKALAALDTANKKLDAALAKWAKQRDKRAAEAKAAGADPETGEIESEAA